MITTYLNFTTVRPQLVVGWSRVKNSLAGWHRRARSRDDLASLSDQQLQDIGISRCSANFEASKPFWML